MDSLYGTPLTLDIIHHHSTKGYYPREVLEILDLNGYTHLGWLNDNVVLPILEEGERWERWYKNDSGSYCIYGNKNTKQYYCVDMGD